MRDLISCRPAANVSFVEELLPFQAPAQELASRLRLQASHRYLLAKLTHLLHGLAARIGIKRSASDGGVIGQISPKAGKRRGMRRRHDFLCVRQLPLGQIEVHCN